MVFQGYSNNGVLRFNTTGIPLEYHWNAKRNLKCGNLSNAGRRRRNYADGTGLNLVYFSQSCERVSYIHISCLTGRNLQQIMKRIDFGRPRL